ncbi:alr0857 family protein [Calothrix rhizosoleniae]|uniref:alr0857 family protein n=1 Tax=Calothrix rhizosoleniae TaxID=888997 RepID=UPI000B49971B|nr:alr0857 family protein [Calothrix rhizosoleniae]
MLKLTYTENNFNLEYLNQSLTNWVANRVTLAMRTVTNIHIQPSHASFSIPVHSRYMHDLENLAAEDILELCNCDIGLVEITLQGTWLTSDMESDLGLFVTELEPSIESLFQQLEPASQFCHI